MRAAVFAVLVLFSGCKKGGDAQPHHEDRNEPQEAPTQASLKVTIGGAAETWGPEAFAKATKGTGTNNGGQARDQWSLRDLVHANAGPTARAVSVTGSAGTKPIDEAAWNDADKTPILHSTRRGTLKFRWTDKDGKWGETVTNDVTAIEVVK